jgi:hypothetical protein
MIPTREALLCYVTRARVLLCGWMVAAALVTLPVAAEAAGEPATPRCVGLACDGPGSPDYIPEAHGGVPLAADVNDLTARSNSGFFEIPAPVYQGDVQPPAVVYLSKPGQFRRMPASVRDLRVVSDYVGLGAQRSDHHRYGPRDHAHHPQ